MKICWDNLEKVKFTKNGTLRKGSTAYLYKEACEKCGEPYLTIKSVQSKFCSRSCAFSGENNPMYGKTHTVEVKKKISESASNRTGDSNSNWRGGTHSAGLATYGVFKDRLNVYENIRKQKDTGLLEVTCAYCGQWFAPTLVAVNNRIAAINNLNRGEHHLYCSENCKLACPIYKKIKYPKGFKHISSREVNPYLRQMIFERDNWTCQICGKTSKEAQLHVHHMDPVAQNPMFQNDVDSCITLCKKCHKMVHSRIGCRYVDLRCKKL